MRFEPVIPHRFKLGEGPHWDGSTGKLSFVDIVAGEAWEFDGRTRAARSWRSDGPVAAIIPRAKGGYLIARASDLAFLDPETGVAEKWIDLNDDPGNRANETRVDPAGRLWLGSMQNNIGPKGEDLPITRSSGVLHRVSPEGSIQVVQREIGVSNTLCWDPARGRMYFADTMKNTIWAFDWDRATGDVSNRRVHFGPHDRGHADGSAIDAEGYLWNARWDGSCILRIAPDGGLDRIVETPARNTTSCVFGGDGLRTLYVTSARQGLGDRAQVLDGALFAAEAPVAGQECTPFAG